MTHTEKIIRYYGETQATYTRWGGNAPLPAVHYGYVDSGTPVMQVHEHQASLARMNEEIIRRMGITDGQTIVDAGCGFGALAGEIQRRFPHATIVAGNITESQVSVLGSYLRKQGVKSILPITSDFHALPVGNDTVDHVVFLESFSHSLYPRRVLAEACRVVKPAGKVTLTDFSLRKDYDEYDAFLVEKGWMIKLSHNGHTPALLQHLGLKHTAIDLTDHVLPSVAYSYVSAASHDPAQEHASATIWDHREATKAFYRLMKRGGLLYTLLQGEKLR